MTFIWLNLHTWSLIMSYYGLKCKQINSYSLLGLQTVFLEQELPSLFWTWSFFFKVNENQWNIPYKVMKIAMINPRHYYENHYEMWHMSHFFKGPCPMSHFSTVIKNHMSQFVTSVTYYMIYLGIIMKITLMIYPRQYYENRNE